MDGVWGMCRIAKNQQFREINYYSSSVCQYKKCPGDYQELITWLLQSFPLAMKENFKIPWHGL